MVRLVRALRECQTPGDESAVGQIVRGLLVEPGISQQAAERDYGALLVESGYASITSLESLTRKDLLEMGVLLGHATPVLQQLHVTSVAPPQFQPAHGVPPDAHVSSGAKPSGARVAAFPSLPPSRSNNTKS